MPQPTRPASVMMTQYCPLYQRLLMPTAQPFLNCKGREIVRGRASLIDELLARIYRFAPGGSFRRRTNQEGAKRQAESFIVSRPEDHFQIGMLCGCETIYA